MSVINTRAELAALCEQLPAVLPTARDASDLLEMLTSVLDGSTNTDALAAISALRQAVESLNNAGAAYLNANDLLIGYGESM